MSGVFGLVVEPQSLDLPAALERMALMMTHGPEVQRESWAEAAAGVGLGRLSIGLCNPEAQPVVSADGQVTLCLAGELFDRADTPADPGLRRAEAASDADYALLMYQRYGLDSVRRLSGAFTLAVFDRPRAQVVLAADRFGQYPTYYALRGGCLAFAPELKGVLAAPGVPAAPDPAALAQYLRFQQLLGARTFFEDVWLLPPATALVYDLRARQAALQTYWSYADLPGAPARLSFAEAVEEAARRLQAAVRRRLRGPWRAGLYLSGGLDSRTLLAAMPADQPPPVTLTFGLRESRDAHYARQLAARAGARNVFVEYTDGRWVQALAPRHLALTEGFHSWPHMHGLNTLDQARQHFEVNLSGFAGDQTLGGYSVEPELSQAPDDEAYTVLLFARLNQTYNWPGLTEAEERLLYTPAAWPRVRDLAFESCRAALRPYLRYDPERRIDYFGLTEIDGRHYFHYITFLRSQLEVRPVYLDDDLLEFVWALPRAFRAGRRLEIAVLNRLNPALALVPVDRDALLPTEDRLRRGAHRLWQTFKRRFNRHVFPLFRDRFTLHTDYEGWLRTDLRDWAEGILLGARLRERGLFNPDFVRSLWRRHLAGHEPWLLGKLAPIMTYELLMQALCDPSP